MKLGSTGFYMTLSHKPHSVELRIILIQKIIAEIIIALIERTAFFIGVLFPDLANCQFKNLVCLFVDNREE